MVGALGVLSGVARAAEHRLSALAADVASLTDAALWSRVRSEFLLDPGLTHLNCGSLGAVPRTVVDAVCEAMRELERNPVMMTWGPMGEAMEAVRARAAAFLGASPDEVCLTRNTTEGMNLVGSGLDLKSGDEILTTDHEHPGGMSCWQHAAEFTGARIVQVRIPTTPGRAEEILQRIEDGITPRTRVCSVSHVDTLTGLQMPLARIADLTRPRGILLVCDGAQAPGMLKIDVKALGVDTYASSSHKWMLAPKGSGLLYIRSEVRDRVRPAMLRSGFRAYSASAGTRNIPHILGHGLAMEFHETLGRERVEARCRSLCNKLRASLQAVPSVRVLTPPTAELSSGMCTIALERGKAAAIAARLYETHRIVVKTVPATMIVDRNLKPENFNALRISTHVFNGEDDISKFVDALGRELPDA